MFVPAAPGVPGALSMVQLPEPGESIRLEWGEADEPLRARVTSRDGSRIEISPTTGPWGAYLPTAQPVSCIAERPDALYVFTARCHPGPGGSARWILEFESGRQERLQRREFFRMRIHLPLLVAAPGAPFDRELGKAIPYLSPREPAGEYRLLRLSDLSGGGCLANGWEPWLTPGTVHVGYLYIDDGGGPLPLRLLVVRADEERGETAFHFVEMRERRRERVLRALYREYRRQRANRPETA
ncbi:MAG: PilZ domain-containing protein [Candidatus Eisenbacteria bacterium]|nr:PilZ domain-containing protein [Candidatus Eisenbacteria bacterium]